MPRYWVVRCDIEGKGSYGATGTRSWSPDPDDWILFQRAGHAHGLRETIPVRDGRTVFVQSVDLTRAEHNERAKRIAEKAAAAAPVPAACACL